MSEDVPETSMYLRTKHRWNYFQNKLM